MKVISSYLGSHFKENFTIHEVGMKLIPDHDSKIRKSLEKLVGEAPPFTYTDLKFTNIGEKIEGELSVSGGLKQFCSKTTGQSPFEIYKKLKREFEKEFFPNNKRKFLHKHFSLTFSNQHKQMTGGLAS